MDAKGFDGYESDGDWHCVPCNGKMFDTEEDLLRHLALQHGISPHQARIDYEERRQKEVYLPCLNFDGSRLWSKHSVRLDFHTCKNCGNKTVMPLGNRVQCDRCGEVVSPSCSEAVNAGRCRLPLY